MSWSISVSGSFPDVKAVVDAAQPTGGSSKQAVQHFMNHKELIRNELKEIEQDMKDDPAGMQGIMISANGHHDGQNRSAQCTIKRIGLVQKKAAADATEAKQG